MRIHSYSLLSFVQSLVPPFFKTLLISSAIGAALLLINSCAHYRTIPNTAPEYKELSRAMEFTLSEELKQNYESAQLKDFNLTSVEQKGDAENGTLRVTYSFSFTTDSEDTGEVAHQVNSQASISKKGNTYTVEEALVRSQELIFSKPLEVERRRQ